MMPLSPGFSSLLAELNDDADDTGGSHANILLLNGASSHQLTDISENQLSGGSATTGPIQHSHHLYASGNPSQQVFPDFRLPPEVNWGPPASYAVHPSNPNSFLPTTVPLAFTTGADPSHPSHAKGSAGDGTTTSAHLNRRGRKPQPRLQDLQQQLDSLVDQFQQLDQENTFLRTKLKALERVVPYREANFGFLVSVQGAPQLAAAGEPATSSHAEAGAAIAAATAAAVKADAEARRTVGATTEALMEDARRAQEARQAGAAPGTQPSLLVAPVCGVGAWGTAPALRASGTPAVVALCPRPDGDVPAVTPEIIAELRRVTPHEFRLLWRHCVMQVAVLLLSAEALGPTSPQHARFTRYVDRMFAYMDMVLLLSPICFVQSMYINIETGQHERPGDDFWIALGRSLKISKEQFDEIKSLAVVYETNVMPVVRERVKLASELSASISVSSRQQHLVSSEQLITSFSAIEDLTERLRRNVIKEHQAHWDFGDFLCLSVLSPLQMAKAMCASYPYIPDGVAVMHALQTIGAGDPGDAPRER